ncbi:MAG: GDP-fucose synthetase [Verrucomicrobia bacterium CG_4_10_14_3_um_filter_43_23]|nr:MAG: GDP-fucose synthetase [Verrucomicrobia bacterium CG1_02_43_26]PIP59102.1 MAG: GDP-fucose synthetase [Verrucomicrobia bacterium CG22_combo_CG10-13_8_21_14_all_43_17]PIX59180.1 MAG: GDP-fucose synthetase [Verrucomicrobia bacterium CG_4_10_14_3_um_filter_43_23]PIY61414.1 MAG: GDP-fucose synthetase [Verrucomicrobia bacterium CG_4_10_14_0_8_um_filter_43_34]PJA44189.1 MAG: GDP-fucose synthetase [Verrucomicrobia bacterium CG_4_9_14_3_um_filter_43_20]
MNILVTGATGFLGSNLCKELEVRGHNVVKLGSKNCDLTKADSLNAFNDTKYDQIFHLAAWTQAGDFCLHHPGEQWIINQLINTHVLMWWKEHQPQAKMIAIGTSCVYDPELPLSEEYYLKGKPIDSLFTYGMTKKMLYVGLLALHKQFGLNYLYVIPSTLYGAGYHTDGRQMHFIFDLMRKIIQGKEKGDTVTLWGDGHQKRELVLVNDFVRILLELNENTSNDFFNIGAGEEYPIRRFAETISEIVGYDHNEIEYDTQKYVGAKSKCLSVEKIKKALPGYKLTHLDEGLNLTIDWFQNELRTSSF